MNPIPEHDDPVVPSWPLKLHRTPSVTSEWEPLLAMVMQPGEVSAEARALPGMLATAQLLGGGVMSELTMPPLTVVHRAEHVQRARDRAALVHIVLDGAGELYQSGQALRFNAGDITFREAHLPSRVHFAEATRFIALRLPFTRWQGYLPPTAGGTGIASRDHTLTAMVHGFVRQMEEGFPTIDRTAMAALEQSFVLMLGAVCRQFDPSPAASAISIRSVRWQQVHDYIDAHLFEPSLSPASCASALNISERYLHKVLSQRDERFSQLVLNRRLDCCAARLRDSRFDRYRIASIAYQCGFQDPAHFSRTFSMRFGVAPRIWRQARAGA
jgi:AraC family transcriptional regulator, positive regulator of tynA and feaB